jgi:hypothetical protein
MPIIGSSLHTSCPHFRILQWLHKVIKVVYLALKVVFYHPYSLVQQGFSGFNKPTTDLTPQCLSDTIGWIVWLVREDTSKDELRLLFSRRLNPCQSTHGRPFCAQNQTWSAGNNTLSHGFGVNPSVLTLTTIPVPGIRDKKIEVRRIIGCQGLSRFNGPVPKLKVRR